MTTGGFQHDQQREVMRDQLKQMAADKAKAAAPDRLTQAANTIRDKLKYKREEYADFRRHLDFRVKEEDAHGSWDCAVCLSEVSNYIDGLLFALEALGAEP